MISKLWF